MPAPTPALSRFTRLTGALIATALALPGICADASAPAAIAAPIALAPCTLSDPLGLGSIAAQCGWLIVPENREQRGRSLRLYMARVPAISHRSRADPLFVLAGGPGMAATEFYAAVAPAFERIRRDRDIVLLDQRGTGQSNRLDCAIDDNELLSTAIADVVRITTQCRDQLAARADLAAYTTAESARDLEALRAALGYERINLYGASYGTRLAQHYARLYPQRVRALILDGVAAPQVALGPQIALDAEAALESVLDRCAAARDCRQAFGDVHRDYRQVRAKLEVAPVEVILQQPLADAPGTIAFGPEHLAIVLRLATYAATRAATLPYELHRAAAAGDYRPLAARFVLTSQSLERAIAVGLNNSVVCSEDLPYVDPAHVDRAALQKSFMGARALDAMQAVCEHWPRGQVDDGFREPLAADTPALLLSGAADPVTPPRYAELAMEKLPAARHIVLPGQGHGQLTRPCMDKLMAEFLDSGDASALDTSCLERVVVPPFWLSRAGPAP
ncbi:MAG: alpha/beta hydrolase [Steroidobacteraceae bacterium]